MLCFLLFSSGHDARHHGRFDQKDSLAAVLWPHSRRPGNGMCTVSDGMIQYALCSLRAVQAVLIFFIFSFFIFSFFLIFVIFSFISLFIFSFSFIFFHFL